MTSPVIDDAKVHTFFELEFAILLQKFAFLRKLCLNVSRETFKGWRNCEDWQEKIPPPEGQDFRIILNVSDYAVTSAYVKFEVSISPDCTAYVTFTIDTSSKFPYIAEPSSVIVRIATAAIR